MQATIGIQVDLYWYSIGEPDLFFSFFSSIVVHLEKSKWGSRFPVVMNDLYQGKVEVDKLEACRKELEVIREELKQFGPDQVIWDCEHPEKMPPWDEIDPDIKDLSEYYISSSGEDLFEVLLTAIQDGLEYKADLEIETL